MSDETNTTGDAPAPLMYLLKSDWSPRFDSTFYTVKVEGKTKILDELPPAPASIGGGDKLPAYYYTVVVYREHNKTTLLRRYSQFQWLFLQLVSNPPVITEEQQDFIPAETPIRLPPGTCPWFQWQTEEFAQNRMEQLDEFLEDVLRRPGYANHAAMIEFLEL